ncbi:MAG: ADP-forming succinate--CoA ligase subunit beta [Planctomycetota bacterium]|nr:ADP-forming succinate--CoA ligase subunit beta [Planctomycetota bacterium]
MRLHEYRAKELLCKYGVPVTEGMAAATPEEAAAAFEKLGGTGAVVKAQILAGGRGKAGGVRPVRSAVEAARAAADLLGKPLVTAQTGPGGQMVGRVYVQREYDLERELYLAAALDRSGARAVMIGCAEGGVEIEDIAARRPGKIIREVLAPWAGIQPYQARRLAFRLGLSGRLLAQTVQFATALARAFFELDCVLAEINPLVVTKNGALLALDAKLEIDDNAMFRHPELASMSDQYDQDAAEAEARKHDLSYVRLDGDIGCLVNGAGLAMATMDMIKLCGGSPANFLDVGGGTDRERVAAAFGILAADARLKAILVNIFGGIVRCDLIAEGILEAARRAIPRVPIVVRLEGNSAGAGLDLLAGSGLDIIRADSLADAARQAVAAAASDGRAQANRT